MHEFFGGSVAAHLAHRQSRPVVIIPLSPVPHGHGSRGRGRIGDRSDAATSGRSRPRGGGSPGRSPKPFHLSASNRARGGRRRCRHRAAVSHQRSVPRWAEAPVATLGINVVGAFLLGVLLELLADHSLDTGWSRRIRLGVGTGGLGGFTTYSALATDTVILAAAHPGRAAGYALLTVLLGASRHSGRDLAVPRASPPRPRRCGEPDVTGPVAVLLMCVAGGIGAALRLVLDGLIRTRIRSSYPVGDHRHQPHRLPTARTADRFRHGQLLPHTWQLIVGTGLLGGYTTFSTASFETVRLIEDRRYLAAALNGLGMLIAGIAAAAIGFATAS